jgi:mannose-6-phosphate isomerase-like protein (cupin superfamily)
MSATDINVHPIHLGRNATAEVEPEYTGDPQWYEEYGSRRAEDGFEGRLVGMYRFTADWDSWEVHPHGSEVVLCVAGSMTLHQEKADGSRATVTLTAGQYAINEPGTWHTADVEDEATAVFITAGMGTEHRPR